jgi:hypothetical protein
MERDELERPSPEEIALLRDAEKAARYQTMRDRGRRIGGVPGAIVAGVMVALRDIYDTPKRENGDVVVDAPSEPHDVDRDGMNFAAAEIGSSDDVAVTALERRAPLLGRRRRPRRPWRR